MLKSISGGAVALIALAMLAGCGPQDGGMASTVAALQATVVAQEQALITCEAVADRASQTPQAAPTQTAVTMQRATIAIPSPRPLTTVQRPPTATPSPGPTATPTNTPTATPIPDAAVGTLPANLRAGPNVRFEILAELPAGSPLSIVGKSADSEWLLVVTTDGTQGWMYYLPLQIFVSLDTVAVVE